MTVGREPGAAAAHAQHAYDVRLEWGPTGGGVVAEGADVAVVVDVLSFTTTLTIAVGRGTRVFPYRWKDERAAHHAVERRAVLAVGRSEALAGRAPTPSLSPARMLAGEPVDRLVLPSPNGSTICAALAGTGQRVVGAALRNRAAVAGWVAARAADGARIAVVPSGERWTDGSLRPALEDLWGAGAVLHALLPDLPPDARVSPEAEHAATAYEAVAGRLPQLLADCVSGRELVAGGFADDVAVAADLDVDAVVPVLGDDGFAAAGD